MATIEVSSETQAGTGWGFQVTVEEGSRRQDFAVTLSRMDYDTWSGGRAEPARVVRAVFEFLLDNEPLSSIMQSFDCSVVRRYFPKVDDELPKRL